MLYKNFADSAEFRAVNDFAKDIGSLLWADEAKGIVVAKKSGHEQVKQFCKTRRAGTKG